MHFRSVFPEHATDSNSLKLHGGRHTEKKTQKVDHIKCKNVKEFNLLLIEEIEKFSGVVLY